jgi:hypothetical protein
MTEQDQAEFRERHRVAVKHVHSQQAAQQQEWQQAQLESVSNDGFTMTVDSLMLLLQSSDDPDKETEIRFNRIAKPNSTVFSASLARLINFLS